MKKRIFSALMTLVMVICALGVLPPFEIEAAAPGLGNFSTRKMYNNDFADIKSSDWYYDSVVDVFRYGLMVGKGEGKFDPLGKVHVSEIVTVAARLNAIYNTGSDLSFTGRYDNWYTPYYDYAREHGVALDGLGGADKTATRAEFAQVIASAMPDEAFEEVNNVDMNAIPDVKSGDKAASYIYKLYRAGIVVGNDAQGTYYPKNNITRAEVAAIVVRAANANQRRYITLENKKTDNNDINDIMESNILEYEKFFQYMVNLEKNSDKTQESEIALYEKADEYLNRKKETGEIQEYGFYKDSVTIKYNSGMEFIYTFGFNEGVRSDPSKDDCLTSDRRDYNEIQLFANTNKIDFKNYRNIITMQPFIDEFNSTVTDDAARLIAGKYANYKFEKNIDSRNVTVDQMFHLNDYKVIILDGHGGFSKTSNSPVIFIGEVWSNEDPHKYKDIIDELIDESKVNDEAKENDESQVTFSNCFVWQTCKDNKVHYGITSKFIETVYKDGDFNDAVIFMNCCYSAENNAMANAFISKGASVYYGFTNTVEVNYSDNMLYGVFYSLVHGSTAQEAMDNAKNIYGPNDERKTKWYQKIQGKYKENDEPSELQCIGEEKYTYKLSSPDKVVDDIRDEELKNIKFKFFEENIYDENARIFYDDDYYKPIDSTAIKYECLKYTGKYNYSTDKMNGALIIMNGDGGTTFDYLPVSLPIGKYRMQFSAEGYEDTVREFEITENTEVIEVFMISKMEKYDIPMYFIDSVTEEAITGVSATIRISKLNPDIGVNLDVYERIGERTVNLTHTYNPLSSSFNPDYTAVLPTGDYRISVVIDGYEKKEFDIKVTDKAFTAKVFMTKTGLSGGSSPSQNQNGGINIMSVECGEYDYNLYQIIGIFTLDEELQKYSPEIKNSWGGNTQLNKSANGVYSFTIEVDPNHDDIWYKDNIRSIVISCGSVIKGILIDWNGEQSIFEY